jgi:hypothetical protein
VDELTQVYFEDSAKESNVIHGFPIESEIGSHVDADGRSGLGAHAGSLSSLPAAAWTQGDGRPAVPGGASFLHGGERALAGLAGAVRTLELGVEALRPVEQGGCVRGVLRHAGFNEQFGASHADVRFHHRARACLGGGRKRGQQNQALGRSRGGFTTKIHAKSDASGAIIGFDLTGGERADATHFLTLLDIGPDIAPRAAIGDKGYSSKANRAAARARGIAPVIPHKSNETHKPAYFAKILYKARARIEQGIGLVKRFKRVALRCEKTERNYRSIVSFAAGLCLIKFVHTA